MATPARTRFRWKTVLGIIAFLLFDAARRDLAHATRGAPPSAHATSVAIS